LNKYLDHGRLVFIDALVKAANSESSTDIFRSITNALTANSSELETILILDFFDIPLALHSISSDEALTELIRWRTQVHAVLVTLATDILTKDMDPHLFSASPQPILLQQQQFLLTLAHQADMTLSTKALDSGSSKDVSGVVRITSSRNNSLSGDKELLYFVDSGSSKPIEVWERGGLRS
jgi:elongator complex protein 6